jgi:serine/threonine protein kinase
LLDHKNIIKLEDVIHTEDYIWFVTEFCKCDLQKYLKMLV